MSVTDVLPQPDPAALSLENMKSSLYCVRCNKILRDAMEVPCCHALYCAGCVHPDGIPYDPTAGSGADNALVPCCNCGRPMTLAAVPNLPVRRLVSTIPMPCPIEGCSEIVAAGSLQDHVQRQCDYRKVGCKHFDRGCAASMLYKDSIEHETTYCIFRDVPCPQGCGVVMQWRECADHFLFTCPRSLVDCEVKCGALVERGKLFDHMNNCPMKPLPCPYRTLGCTMKHLLRRPDLEDHMNLSVHAHLMLLDDQVKRLQKLNQTTCVSHLRGASHDWDPGHVLCVARWDAQLSSIYAMTLVDGYIVTGCASGTLMVFHPFDGTVVGTTSTGDEPICSLLGMGDGRLLVGRRFHSVLLYTNRGTDLIACATLHPKEMTESKGVLALCAGTISKEVHLSDKPQFLHPELYAVPTCEEDMQCGPFDVVFAATERHIRMLDAATLEEVEHIDGGNLGTVTSLVVHKDAYLVSGSADGSVRVHDMRTKRFPQLYWIQCFGGVGGVTALCVHPNSAMWRTGAAPSSPPLEDTDGPVVLCIGGSDGSVGFWDFKAKMSCDNVIERGHRGAVVCILPVDGSMIATGGADEYWRAWDGKAATSLADLPGSMYCAVAYDNMLYAAGSQGCIRSWTSGTLKFNAKRQAPQKKQVPL